MSVVQSSAPQPPGGTLSLGTRAELARWGLLRKQSRQELITTLTGGAFSLIAAFCASSLLVFMLDQIEVPSGGFDADPDEQSVQWLRPLGWSFIVAALLCMLAYLLSLGAVLGRIPAFLWPACQRVPWLGSSLRSLALAELFASLHQSVCEQQSYPIAFQTAASAFQQRSLRPWLTHTSDKLAGGQSISHCLQTFPGHDLSLAVAGVMAEKSDTAENTVQLWREISEEAHLACRERTESARRSIYFLMLVASVSVACVSIFVPSFLMRKLLYETMTGFYFFMF